MEILQLEGRADMPTLMSHPIPQKWAWRLSIHNDVLGSPQFLHFPAVTA